MPRDKQFYDSIYRGMAENIEAKSAAAMGKSSKYERSQLLLKGLRRLVNWIKAHVKH